MFAKTIIDSDAFLDMPQTTQLLYFHLSMRADDDGFINNPKSIMRNVRCTEDDIKVLISKKFIIPFENGIVVIKHWKIHNYIAKDRYKETKYKEEKATLALDENNAYAAAGNGLYTECIQSVDEMDTQVRLGKERLGEVRKGKDKKTPTVYYPTDDLLNQAFTDYVKMRKELKKPMTERAVQLAMTKLEHLSGGDNDTAIKILEQSIERSWAGLFELKGNNEKKQAAIDWDKV
jgi:hypothetical protein